MNEMTCLVYKLGEREMITVKGCRSCPLLLQESTSFTMVLPRGWEWQQGSMLSGSEQQRARLFALKIR